MKLHLVGQEFELVQAWRDAFASFPEVQIQEWNILKLAQNTIVSPANGYGFMDGGIDRQYTDFFGFQPQEEVQNHIQKRPEGYLPVGAAVLVRTGLERIPYMIAAPTMLLPGAVPKAHCFFAMAAVLKVASAHPDVVRTVYCPGLATGTGRVAPLDAAGEMAKAYGQWRQKRDVEKATG